MCTCVFVWFVYVSMCFILLISLPLFPSLYFYRPLFSTFPDLHLFLFLSEFFYTLVVYASPRRSSIGYLLYPFFPFFRGMLRLVVLLLGVLAQCIYTCTMDCTASLTFTSHTLSHAPDNKSRYCTLSHTLSNYSYQLSLSLTHTHSSILDVPVLCGLPVPVVVSGHR